MSRLLVIPDVHQDIFFLSRILERENLDRFDQLILLGDYFDANNPALDGEEATRVTAQFLLELVKLYPRKVRLLWGNHDVIYCRLREYVLRVGPEELERLGEAHDLLEQFRRALWINQVWPGDMWFRLELAVLHGDMLFSHAGIHPEFWPAGEPEAAFQDLLMQWESVIGDLYEQEDHPLLGAGPARGGQQSVGGPLWLDWSEEFEDGLPYRQVVGHTARGEPRRNGRSWCIDCAQTGYAVIEEGELRFKQL